MRDVENTHIKDDKNSIKLNFSRPLFDEFRNTISTKKITAHEIQYPISNSNKKKLFLSSV